MTPNNDPFVASAKAGEPVDHCLVIDAHAHLGECPGFSTIDGDIGTVVRVMDRLGIDAIAPSSVPACIGGVHSGNDQIIDAVQRYPDRVIGYMAVNPARPHEATAELQRCLDAGLTALKIHNAVGVPYTDKRWEVCYTFAAEHGLPILAHTWGADLDALEPYFVRHEQVNWLLGHSGVVEREHYVRLARTYPNVYLELCQSGCTRGIIEYFLDQGLRDKLLWGSDATFLGHANQFGRVLFARIAPEDKRAILGANARRVLPMPGRLADAQETRA